jgi:hypothetical protein
MDTVGMHDQLCQKSSVKETQKQSDVTPTKPFTAEDAKGRRGRRKTKKLPVVVCGALIFCAAKSV